MRDSLAVLIISCDKYKDLWRPFLELWFRYWPDCPYEIYLGTNHQDYEHKRVVVVKAGEDKSWADGVKNMIAQLEQPYILTIFDDFFLAKKVDSALIANALSLVETQHISCFRLQSFSMPAMGRSRRLQGQANVFEILPQDEYCVNAGIAIWKRETLLELLKPGYSAWDFEVKNSARCHASGTLPGKFVTAENAQFAIRQGVVQGKWLPSTLSFCRRNGIVVDTTQRATMSVRDVSWEYSKFLSRRILPSEIRRLLKRLLIRFGYGDQFASSY